MVYQPRGCPRSSKALLRWPGNFWELYNRFTVFKVKALKLYTGLQPVRVTGLHTLESSIHTLITRLYAGFSIPEKPITQKHVPKSERNMRLILRYSAGEGLSDLAREFRLSPQRVFQIVNGRRN